MNLYKKKVISSLDKISENYNYFLFGNDNLKSFYVGSISSDLDLLIPSSYSKEELKNNLFTEIETFYSITNSSNEYQKNYKPFTFTKSKTFSTGYGVIITKSDLLVLDIDNRWEYHELLELCPNIITDCKFKRINLDCPYRMHLYYKNPNGFEISGVIRRVKLKTTKLWICGLNKKKFPSSVDTAHLFRNENSKYDLIGYMDDITECPQVIIDKIIENENKFKMSSI
jgi:hypothetical protein